MLRLTGYLTASEIDSVTEMTKLRFKDTSEFCTAEAVILHEQRMLEDDVINDLCMQAYYTALGPLPEDFKLETPQLSYIPTAIINRFAETCVVPIRYHVASNTVIVGVLPENYNKPVIVQNYRVQKVRVPIYYYVNTYIKYYGNPDFLLPIPVVEKLNLVIQEAIQLGASDITMSSRENGAIIYYTRYKRIIYSNRQLEKSDIPEIVSILSTRAGATIDITSGSNDPRYFGVELDMHHRGRVLINGTYYGQCISIRVLSNDALDITPEDLHLSPNTINFIRDVVLSKEVGLRVFIGETSSGKNTTILSGLRELVLQRQYKIVSVEMPVEILVDGIEQIQVGSEEEFAENADSLIRANPDIIYFTEITSLTAQAIMRAANTSKAVYTSLHANNIAAVISRLMDITKMDANAIIDRIQSCVYQVLVRNEEEDYVYPVNRCVHFTQELKDKLYGKELYEIQSIIREVENEWKD